MLQNLLPFFKGCALLGAAIKVMALAPVLRLGAAGGVCYYSVKAGVWSDGRNEEVSYLGLLASKRRVQDETNLIKTPVRTGKLKGGRSKA